VEAIGRPIANTRIYILDGHGRPVPVGVSGEIYIGGDGVARGYLNRPELTAERFVKDPFQPERSGGNPEKRQGRRDAGQPERSGGNPEKRMYRTGDLGRWRADGTIEYLGRNDHQVKIRGYRIELGEIETQLLGCEGVAEAVVLARESAPHAAAGEQRLVAYYTVKGQEPTIERLRGQLESKLPQYMVPAAYVRLESMPLTPNGKLDRRALPAPEGEAFVRRGYEAPQGELESTLAQLWQELLQVERVGRHDNFFELGGHSLLAVASVSRLRNIGFNVRLEQLFKSPTVASLTEYILSASDGDLLGMSCVVLREGGRRRPLFLAHEMTGDVFPLLPLAHEIEADVPIYGLPLVERPIPESIEQLARAHVAAIRQVQPVGPYRLAGHSFGGVLAYEIAAQLIGADETVEFLGLLDPRRPTPGTADVPAKSIEEVELGALRLYVQYWFPKMYELHRDAVMAMQSAVQMLDYLKESGLLPGALDLVQIESWARTYRVLRAALMKYEALSLSAPTYLFVPDEDPSDKGWRAVLGDSLHIEKVTGTHLSMIQQPHVRTLGQAMSRALDAAEDSKRERGISSYSPMIALQGGGSEQVPIFCIPGAGASVTSFLPLSAALGTHVATYGLQPRGLDGTLVPHYTVQDAACAYVKAIRRIRPQGPYRLLGHSFGGWIALEAACQLRAVDASVDPVVLFDTELPSSGARHVHHGRVEVLRKLIEVLELQHSRKLPLTVEELRRMDADAQLQALLELLVREKIMPRSTRLAAIRGLVRVFGTNLNTPYAPTSQFDGEVIIVKPADLSSSDADVRDGVAGSDDAAGGRADSWHRYARRVRTITTPGNHMTMLDRSNIDSFVRDTREFWSDSDACVSLA
jgi:thioesterase domain-containing protein